MFVWSDVNGDGHVQPEEVAIIRASSGGVTMMPDLSFVVSRVDNCVMRYAPQRFTDKGAPVYELDKGETLAAVRRRRLRPAATKPWRRRTAKPF